MYVVRNATIANFHFGTVLHVCSIVKAWCSRQEKESMHYDGVTCREVVTIMKITCRSRGGKGRREHGGRSIDSN